MEKLLIIEGDEDTQKLLREGLAKEYRILSASNAGQGLILFRQHRPRLVTIDLGAATDHRRGEEGFRCLADIMGESPLAKIIVTAASGDRENVLRAVQMGVYDIFYKPIDLPQLKVVLDRAAQVTELEEESLRLHRHPTRPADIAGIYGQCPQMREVFRTIRKVAACNVPVLVLGESGTGKELVARAIHDKSPRHGGSFVPINCGAIPENLLESELFGYERGAFTGAQARVQGKVEFAHKGTLFLDEIGELSPALQVKLLRFLQEKVIQRVGGREDIEVDARIIAATHLDIRQAIAGGKFREDLYYRIGVVSLHLPPLRERVGDIRLLAQLFLQRFSRELGRKARGFSTEAMEAMQNHSWPGNVRELENRIKRGVIMCESPVIDSPALGLADSPPPAARPPGQAATLRQAKDRLESEMVISAIQEHTGNIARAAEALGVSRPTIYDLMRKHGFHVSSQEKAG